MGFDWENTGKLISSMEWSLNPTLNINLSKQILTEFASLGKRVLGRGANMCNPEKAGAVPCNLLYFPHSDHRCQIVQRLGKIFDDVAMNCNADWRRIYGDKMNTLIQNNQSGRQNKPCEDVKWL